MKVIIRRPGVEQLHVRMHDPEAPECVYTTYDYLEDKNTHYYMHVIMIRYIQVRVNGLEPTDICVKYN